MLLNTWVESRRCRVTFVPKRWRMRSVVASKACRPRSWASKPARKLCSVFCARWASSGVSSRACCHNRLNSSCSSASASVSANISLSRSTPNTVCTGWLGRPLSSQYKGANCASSISGKARARKVSAQLACRRRCLAAGTRLRLWKRVCCGSFWRNISPFHQKGKYVERHVQIAGIEIYQEPP